MSGKSQDRQIYQWQSTAIRMTKLIMMRDSSNVVGLLACRLESDTSIDRVLQALENTFGEMPRHKSKDVAAAWVLSARYRRLISLRGKIPGEIPAEASLELDVQTWILGRPQRLDAKFTGWFDAAPDDYRVLLHRLPAWYRGAVVIPLWHNVYHSTSLPIIRLEHYTGARRALARSYLSDLLRAYRSGDRCVEKTVAASGHDFYFTDGRPVLPAIGSDMGRDPFESKQKTNYAK